jgi:excisionase family DNA binding protein
MDFQRRELRDFIIEVLKEFFADHFVPPSESDLLNVKQAATFLDLAEATIYEKTSLKLIPHYKKGKKVFFKRSELIAWMDTGKVQLVKTDDRDRRRSDAIQYLQRRDYSKK